MTKEDKKIEVQLKFNIIVTPITWHAKDLYVAELPEYDIPVAIGDTKDAVARAVAAILFDVGERGPLRYPLDDESLSLRLARYSNSESTVFQYTKSIKVDKSLPSMTEEFVRLLARNIVLLDGGVDTNLDDLAVTRYFACYTVCRKDKEPLFDDYTALHIFGDTFMCVSNRNLHRGVVNNYVGERFVGNLIQRIMSSRHVQGSDIPTWATDLAKSCTQEKRKRLLANIRQLPNEDDWPRVPEDMLKFLRKHADALCKEAFKEQPKGENDE